MKTSIAEPAEKAVNTEDPVTMNLPATDRVIVRKAVRKAVNTENPVTMNLPTTLRVEEPQGAFFSAPVLPVEISSAIVSAPEEAPKLVEMADPTICLDRVVSVCQMLLSRLSINVLWFLRFLVRVRLNLSTTSVNIRSIAI